MKAKMKKIVITIMALVIAMAFAVPASAATKEVPITSISFPTTAIVEAGSSKTLTVSVNPATTTYKTQITWTTADNGTFTSKINGYGTYKNQASSITITGKKAGTGKVTAKVTTLDSTGKAIKTYTLNCAVTTTQNIALKSISLSKTSLNMNVAGSQALTVKYNPTNTTVDKSVTWTSSNKTVASVSSKGTITAKRAGTATITANVDGKKATCKVTVKNPITKLSLSKTSATVNAGGTVGLAITYSPANTTDSTNVTWTSSNTAVATVSKGTVYTKKAGTVTITAKMGSKTASCKVTVKAVAPKYVSTTDCYTKLNAYRKSAKLSTLKKDTKLENIAKTRAKEIVTKFSHTRPNGKSGLTLIPGNLYKGENIAKGQKTCAEVSAAWYKSTGHRANMLNKNYKKVGIAGYQYNGVIYWVQIFSS